MPKIVVAYLSTSGNTKAMADAIVEGAKSKKHKEGGLCYAFYGYNGILKMMEKMD